MTAQRRGARRRTDSDTDASRQYRVTPASEMLMRPIRWLWAEKDAKRVPLGKLVLTVGHGDVGKSTFGCWFIAQVTNGDLPGKLYGTPHNCFIAAAEDDWTDTILPRLYAAGADLNRVFHLDVITEHDEDGVDISLPTDFDLLEQAIREKKSAVVFFEALMSSVDMKLDTHKGRDARVVLQKLGKVSNRTGCTIIGNCHYNKASGSDPVLRILGSVEVRNVARAVINFAHDAKEGIHVLSRGKGNLGKEWPPMEYTIESATFSHRGAKYDVGRFVLGDEASMTAEDILRSESKDQQHQSKRAAAAIWLAGYMGEHGNKVEAKEAMAAAESAGFSKPTIEKAKKDADIESERIGFGKGSTVFWVRTKMEDMRNVTFGRADDGDDGDDDRA